MYDMTLVLVIYFYIGFFLIKKIVKKSSISFICTLLSTPNFFIEIIISYTSNILINDMTGVEIYLSTMCIAIPPVGSSSCSH